MDLKERILSIGTERTIDSRKTGGQGITPNADKTRCNQASEARNSISEDQTLQKETDKNEQIRQQCSRIIQDYQVHIRRAKGNRSKLLKGIRAGEPAEEMLLLATGIISDMTGDEVYRKTTEQEISRRYRKTAV